MRVIVHAERVWHGHEQRIGRGNGLIRREFSDEYIRLGAYERRRWRAYWHQCSQSDRDRDRRVRSRRGRGRRRAGRCFGSLRRAACADVPLPSTPGGSLDLLALLDVQRLTLSSFFSVELCRFMPSFAASVMSRPSWSPTRCDRAGLLHAARRAAAPAGWETSAAGSVSRTPRR